MPDLPPAWAALMARRSSVDLLARWYEDHGSDPLSLEQVRRWACARAPQGVQGVTCPADMRKLLDEEPKLVSGYRLRTRRERNDREVWELHWFVERSTDPWWERPKLPPIVAKKHGGDGQL